MRYLFIRAIFICFSLIISMKSASAQDGLKAAAAFEDGSKAFKDGKYEHALNLFMKANRLKPSWKIEYNIGQSAAAARQWGIALFAFEKYLNLGGDEIDMTRENEVLGEITKLKSKVGFVAITAPAGAAIFVDSFERGVAPLPGPLYVNGSVEQRALAELPDGSHIVKSFSVPSGQTISVDLVVSDSTNQNSSVEVPVNPEQVPTQTAAPPETLDRSKSREPSRSDMVGVKIAGIIAAGMGGAALIAGAVTGGMSLRIHKDFIETCGEAECTSDNSERINRMNTFALAGTVLLPAGGVAAAAGIGMLIFRQVKIKKSEMQQVTVIPAGNGLIIEGRF